jgi:RNA-directed DNA polymerase
MRGARLVQAARLSPLRRAGWHIICGQVCDPPRVARHSWLPLIHYIKRVKRYKEKDGKTVYKNRDIMFASHRDACILSKYTSDLVKRLDQYYTKSGLNDYVIAYRKLGQSNYDFCAAAYRFARHREPCTVLCFDVTGFFDNLDHGILKCRPKGLLGVSELSSDWYAVFRHVTRFSTVERKALEAHPVFSKRMKEKSRHPIATISELHEAGIPIVTNPQKFGIPQGTPISSVFSNLYMLEVDAAMVDACGKIGALYQRYSDDILIICAPDREMDITNALKDVIVAINSKFTTGKRSALCSDQTAKTYFNISASTCRGVGRLFAPLPWRGNGVRRNGLSKPRNGLAKRQLP